MTVASKERFLAMVERAGDPGVSILACMEPPEELSDDFALRDTERPPADTCPQPDPDSDDSSKT